jgi:Cdc6-like AAA superfamily ATPase
MIRSLIKQLSEQLPYTSEALESIFSSCTNGNRTPTTKALRTCLGQLIGEFNHVFVILDALDECADQDELMDSLQEIVTRDLQMLHVLATSRKEKEIEDGFEPILTEDQKVYIQSNLINEDIRAYIYARLQTDKKLKRWQKDEYSRMIEMTLMEKADGM